MNFNFENLPKTAEKDLADKGSVTEMSASNETSHPTKSCHVCQQKIQCQETAELENGGIELLKFFVCSPKCINQYVVLQESKNSDMEKKLQIIMDAMAEMKAENSESKLLHNLETEKRFGQVFGKLTRVENSCLEANEKLNNLLEGAEKHENDMSDIFEKLDIINRRSKKQRTHSIAVGRRINVVEQMVVKVVGKATTTDGNEKKPEAVQKPDEQTADAGGQQYQNRNYVQQPQGRNFDNRGQQQGRSFDNRGGGAGGYQGRGGAGGGHRGGQGSRPPYGQQPYGGQQQRRY